MVSDEKKTMINSHLLIIILAAGSSKRFGEKNKLLETLNEKSVLEYTLDNVLKVFTVDKIIVVTGYQNYKIEALIEKYNVKYIYNKNYILGIGASISLAIRENKIDFDGALILPGDMPLISTLDFKNLVNAFYQNNKTKIISPRFKKQNGNPIILPRSFFNLLKSLKQDEGARKFLLEEDIYYIESSFGTTFDIDSYTDLLKAKLYIKNI